jgi:hypothetical protein
MGGESTEAWRSVLDDPVGSDCLSQHARANAPVSVCQSLHQRDLNGP